MLIAEEVERFSSNDVTGDGKCILTLDIRGGGINTYVFILFTRVYNMLFRGLPQKPDKSGISTGCTLSL